jgi:hypothetical protein
MPIISTRCPPINRWCEHFILHPLLPSLQVNLVNANIDRLSKQHLKQHPRVKARGGKLITKERDMMICT